MSTPSSNITPSKPNFPTFPSPASAFSQNLVRSPFPLSQAIAIPNFGVCLKIDWLWEGLETQKFGDLWIWVFAWRESDSVGEENNRMVGNFVKKKKDKLVIIYELGCDAH